MTFDALVSDLQPHPLNAAIYGVEDVSGLVDQIANSNWIKPLVVNADNKRIISGHRRWLAARELGLSRVPVEYRVFASETDELEALLLENASRDKTPEQKVREAAAWVDIERVKAELRRRAAQNNEAAAELRAEVENFPPQATGKTRDIVAHRVGFGTGKTYEKAAAVVKQADALKAEGNTEQATALLTTLNEKSVHAAYQAITLPEKRQHNVSEIAEVSAAMGCYPVIYADPPWRYEHIKTENRAIENQYPTLSLDEICALPVAEIAHEDSVLFLWATSPKLAEAMRVIEAWGFTYRTCMVWVKDKIGMGYYARQQHELLLIAARGALPVPEPSDRVSSVVYAARNEHSAKPQEFYEVIEGMYPDYQKIELFSRVQREGWAGWGNQYGGA